MKNVELIFICDGETVTVRTMRQIMSMTESEVLEMAKKLGDNNSFVKDGYTYYVCTDKKTYNPETIKKQGNKRFKVSNRIKRENNVPRLRVYVVDGKTLTREELQDLLGISKQYLKVLLTKTVSININGYDIEVKDNSTTYIPMKDGKKHKRMSVLDCAELTGLNPAAIKMIYEKKTYSTRDGWRFL